MAFNLFLKLSFLKLYNAFGSAKVYYFKELNCIPSDTEFEFQRLMSNLSHVSILVMQQLTTDIRGIRVEELKK